MGHLMKFGAICLAIGAATSASGEDATDRGWFFRTGPIGIFFSPGVDLSAGGTKVPGTDVTVDNNYSISFDIGYRFNENVSATFTFGIPPTAEVKGSESLADSYLGDVKYAPAILALQYRIPTPNPNFEPYVGAGVNYTIMLESDDRDVAGFEVDNGWGFVLQAGFETMITERMGAYFDVKKIWIETDASGYLGVGGPPAKAKVTLDPLLVGAGIVWRF
jgi:outer membrane protein